MSEATHIMGVFLAHDGNNGWKVEHLTGVVEKLTILMRTQFFKQSRCLEIGAQHNN